MINAEKYFLFNKEKTSVFNRGKHSAFYIEKRLVCLIVKKTSVFDNEKPFLFNIGKNLWLTKGKILCLIVKIKTFVFKEKENNKEENCTYFCVCIFTRMYRTLHSYKLFWAVCHLFTQRWRTLNIQSRETIGQEDHVTCLKLGPRVNSSPAFLSHLQDAYFL